MQHTFDHEPARRKEPQAEFDLSLFPNIPAMATRPQNYRLPFLQSRLRRGILLPATRRFPPPFPLEISPQ